MSLFLRYVVWAVSQKKKKKKNSHIQMSGNLMLNLLKRGRDFSLTCLIIRMGDYETKHTVTFLNNLPELKVPFLFGAQRSVLSFMYSVCPNDVLSVSIVVQYN